MERGLTAAFLLSLIVVASAVRGAAARAALLVF
jgi:hypothetical protein